MKHLTLLKHILLATLGVIAVLGVARPAAASAYFYTIIGPPNWGFGNPQAPQAYSARTALGGSVLTTPFAAEDYVSLTLTGGAGSGFAYDTFWGEANGFIGADVSVVGAWWTAPVGYWWAGGPGPVQGGALLFFNSFNNGNFYANMLIIGDPPSCDGFCELGAFETQFGLSGVTNTMTTFDMTTGDIDGVTFPGDNNESTPPAMGNYVTYDVAGNGTDFADAGSINAPEAPTGIYLLTGIFMVGAGMMLRRRLLHAA